MTADPRIISSRISVAPQIIPSDVAELKACGYRSIICNRPDGEDLDQPAFADVAAVARKLGLEARHIPIEGGKVNDKDATAFGRALDEMPGPILAYCRSGTRSATLWALSETGRLSAAEILVATRNAGYDTSGVLAGIANGARP